MKKLLIILVLIPIVIFSQNNERKQPLTPYADIKFADGLVVYSVAWNMTLLYPRLKPMVINTDLMRLKSDHNNTDVNGTYIKKSQKAIMEYVNSEPVAQLSEKDKIDYLKLCALLVIWDNNLSEHAVKELGKLSASGNKEIKENAKLVGKLMEFYRGNSRKR